MKKIKSILAIVTIVCFCSFIKSTSSFQYQLQDMILEGTFLDSLNGYGSQKISVVVSIVGEPYGFVKTNTFTVRIKTNKSIDYNKDVLRIAALAYIATNYPDKK